jgi:hypothetical protein
MAMSEMEAENARLKSALATAEARLAQADVQQEQLVAALREEHEAELARLLEATAQHNDFLGGQPQAQAAPQVLAPAYSREVRDGME